MHCSRAAHPRAGGFDRAVAHDDDVVGALGRLIAVRDHDGRAVLHEPVHRLGDERGARGVEVARRLVEQEVVCVAQHGARDADALPLTAREVCAAQTDVLVKARGLFHDARIAVGALRGGDELVLAHLAPEAVGEVFTHRAANEPVALEHIRKAAAPAREVIVRRVLAVEAHRARFGLVQARDELEHRGFARAVAADDGGDLTGGDRDRHIVQHVPIVKVAEAHVVEHDVRAERGSGRAVRALWLAAADAVDLLHRAERAGHGADVHEKLHELDADDAADHVKARQVADGELSLLHELSADDEHDDDEQDGKQARGELIARDDDPVEEVRSVHAPEAVVALLRLKLFGHGALDESERAHALGKVAEAARHGHGGVDAELVGELGVEQADEAGDRDDDQRPGRKQRVVVKQLHEALDDREHAHGEGHDHRKQRCGRGRIGRDTADELVAVVLVIIFCRQVHDLIPEPAAHALADRLLHAAGEVVFADAEQRRKRRHDDKVCQELCIDGVLARVDDAGGERRGLQLGIHHGGGKGKTQRDQQPRQPDAVQRAEGS